MKWRIFSVILVIAFLGSIFVLQYRDTAALYVWTHLRADTLALVLNKEDTSILMDIGLYYFGGGAYDLAKAKNSFESALEADPDVPWAHYQLGRVNFINGAFNKAIWELDKELELHPENKRVHYVRGLVYGYRDFDGDLERAEEDFKQFVSWSPKEWAGYNDLAWIQIQLGKFEEAKVSINVAFEEIPWTKKQTPWLYSTRGSAELNLKDYDAALESFLTAQAISSGVTPEYFLSAYPGNDSGNAEAVFNQYLATLHFNLGIVYENLGKTALAKEAYEAYLARIPEGPFPKKDEIKQKITELDSE